MKFKKNVEIVILIALLVAVIGTAYIFIATIVFNDGDFIGFFNTWHFPMLLAIFIDIAFYKHLNLLKV
jgi:hypothetical protein